MTIELRDGIELRRAFQLPREDEECLAARGFEWEGVIEVSTNWLIIPGYPVPEGYNRRAADLALRIPPSYPDVGIDMVYFHPALALTRGRAIRQLTPLRIDAKDYQQWSRHRTSANPWRPSLDNICTHLLQVDEWLRREVK